MGYILLDNRVSNRSEVGTCFLKVIEGAQSLEANLFNFKQRPVWHGYGLIKISLMTLQSPPHVYNLFTEGLETTDLKVVGSNPTPATKQ
jgi:hypothetical protein